MIDFAAKFCFWTEQRPNETELLSLGLTETLKTPNTITVGSSLDFPMVHKTAPNDCRFMSYGCRKLDWFAESEFLVRPYLSAKVRNLTKFYHDLSRNFEYKNFR
jgi:hypothetical protein